MLIPIIKFFLPFLTASLYVLFSGTVFVAKRGYLSLKNCLWRGLVDDYACYIVILDDSVVIFLFLYNVSLLYITLDLDIKLLLIHKPLEMLLIVRLFGNASNFFFFLFSFFYSLFNVDLHQNHYNKLF